MHLNNNIENKNDIIDNTLNKLSNPENSYTVKLGRFSELYSKLDGEKTNLILSRINNVLSNDEGVKFRGNFSDTLDIIKSA